MNISFYTKLPQFFYFEIWDVRFKRVVYFFVKLGKEK